jgi:DNA-binding NarL/FixJ family response regulator
MKLPAHSKPAGERESCLQVLTTGPGKAGKGKLRVAVVDDDPNMLAMIEEFLRQSQDFECAGCHATPVEALALIPRESPHLVLMDVRMPVMDGVECARRLKLKMPELKVALLTGMSDPGTMRLVAESRCEDVFYKPFLPGQFLAKLQLFAIRSAPQPSAAPLAEMPSSPAGKKAGNGRLLNPRETQVMECFEKGLEYKEASSRLNVSDAVVHKHQHKAYGKLGATNKTEAIALWRQAR